VVSDGVRPSLEAKNVLERIKANLEVGTHEELEYALQGIIILIAVMWN
jgi:hypothetical protein